MCRAAPIAWVRIGIIRRNAGPPGHGGRILDGPHAGYQSPIPQIRQRDRLRHLRRNDTRREDYPHALPHMLKAGSLVFTPPNGANGSMAFYNWLVFEFWRFQFVQKEVARVAKTAIDPPIQKGASFNLEAVKAQIEKAIGARQVL
jgi:hypothetical protein